MRKFFLFGFVLVGISLFCEGLVLAAEPIRANAFIPIVEGQITETGLLVEAEGKVFIEFPKGTQVVKKETRESFAGSLFPPEIIERPSKNPRPRMNELFSFQLLGDTADALLFTDRFSLMSELSRLREKFQNPESFERTIVVRVLAPIRKDVGKLGLWEFRGEDAGWTRRGGMLKESTDPEITVFMSVVRGTGVFTLFDEDPLQDFVPPFPLDQIEFIGEGLDGNPEVDPFEGQVNEIENPTEDDLFSEPQGEIPAVGTEGGLPVVEEGGDELIIPSMTELESEEIFPEEIGFTLEQLHASAIEPFLSAPTLPVAGEQGLKPSAQKFPFMIVFALLFLGGSVFLAFSNRKRV